MSKTLTTQCWIKQLFFFCQQSFSNAYCSTTTACLVPNNQQHNNNSISPVFVMENGSKSLKLVILFRPINHDNEIIQIPLWSVYNNPHTHTHTSTLSTPFCLPSFRIPASKCVRSNAFKIPWSFQFSKKAPPANIVVRVKVLPPSAAGRRLFSALFPFLRPLP